MRDPARSYRESAVRGASPLGLIVILYDEIGRSCRKALQAFEQGNVEARANELTHVVEIIGYLQGVLDFEKGGAVAHNLSYFYDLMRSNILSVNINPTRDGLEMLAREFARVGASWQQAERSLTQVVAPPTEVPHEVHSTGRSSAPVQNRLVMVEG